MGTTGSGTGTPSSSSTTANSGELTYAELLVKRNEILDKIDTLVSTSGEGVDVKALDMEVKNSSRYAMLFKLLEHYERLIAEYPAEEIVYLVADGETPV